MDDLRKHLIRLGERRRDLRRHIRPVLVFLKEAYKHGDYGDQSRNEAFYPEAGDMDEPHMVEAFGPARLGAQYRDPLFKKLQQTLEKWAHRYNSKFMGEPVYAVVESRGLMEGGMDHPLWTVEIVSEHDPVEPSMEVIEIMGEATDPDWLEMTLSRGTAVSTRRVRSKELYDWSPRDVIALMERWL